MLVAGAVGGGAVGEVDGVGGGEGDGLAVEGDGGRVVFARHGGVALGFEGFGFRRRGGHGWLFGRGGAAAAAAGTTAIAGAGGGVFAFEFFVDAVDAQEGLGADGVGRVRFVGGVDVEGVGDARGGNFDTLGVLGGQGAVFERGGEEVDYSEGQTLFGVEGGRLVG